MGNYLDISYPGIDIEQRTEYSKIKIDSIYGMEYISLLEKDINIQRSKEFNDIYKKEGDKITEVDVEKINELGTTYLFIPKVEEIYGNNASLNIDTAYIPYGMKDFNLLFKESEIYTIYIPKDITQIHQFAFKGCKNLETVIIDTAIKRINNETFAEDIHLKYIELPDTIRCIGVRAFKDCKNLNTIKLPEDLRYIENEAFSGCEINKLILPNKLLYINERAFEESKIKTLYIPSSVVHIGKEAFKYSDIEILTIGNSQNTKIREDAFNQSKLKKIILNNSTEKIQEEYKEKFPNIEIEKEYEIER